MNVFFHVAFHSSFCFPTSAASESSGKSGKKFADFSDERTAENLVGSKPKIFAKGVEQMSDVF